jgi:hypothetical protein
MILSLTSLTCASYYMIGYRTTHILNYTQRKLSLQSIIYCHPIAPIVSALIYSCPPPLGWRGRARYQRSHAINLSDTVGTSYRGATKRYRWRNG